MTIDNFISDDDLKTFCGWLTQRAALEALRKARPLE